MLYPMFMKLDKKIVTIIGGGKIAADKIKSLEGTGAILKVVSPDISNVAKELITHLDGCWIPENFRDELIENSFLVIAATDNPTVNEQVYQTAKSLNILVNVVDVNDRCDWFAGSVVRRNDFQIAISGNGKGPAYLSYLRKNLEDAIPDDEELFLDALSEIRNKMKLLHISPVERKNWFWDRFTELESTYQINKGH